MPPSKIVVSDASAILDLAKVRLIESTLALSFEFIIPDVIFSQELLDLGSYTPADLVRLGFSIGSLDGAGVAAAFAHFAWHASRLSLNDCMALAYAEANDGILMTGDGPLRLIAERMKIEVHGVLWAAALMAEQGTCPRHRLVAALQQLHDDPSGRLSSQALIELIRRLRSG